MSNALTLDLSPLSLSPTEVSAWFEAKVTAIVPDYDGGLDTSRQAAEAFGRQAKADNTRRAYRVGVRVFCEWCARHGLTCLPAAPEDVAAFLADQRQLGLKANTIDLRRAAIRYLHWLAGVDLPTGQAVVAETVAGIHRAAAQAGEFPVKKMAATIALIREIIDAIPTDLTGLRDRAMILVGFVGALRASELAKIRVEHLTQRERGLELFLPVSKGDRSGAGAVVFLPYGKTILCPVRALRAWLDAGGIEDGPVFRRIWRAPTPKAGGTPTFVVGTEAIDDGTVRRMLKARATVVNLDPKLIAGHSLKRGAMTTGMDNNIHPTRLKRLGRHKSYSTMDEYLELGNGFDHHPLAGLL